MLNSRLPEEMNQMILRGLGNPLSNRQAEEAMEPFQNRLSFEAKSISMRILSGMFQGCN